VVVPGVYNLYLDVGPLEDDIPGGIGVLATIAVKNPGSLEISQLQVRGTDAIETGTCTSTDDDGAARVLDLEVVAAAEAHVTVRPKPTAMVAAAA
jgi:hypothetical protein